MVNKTCYNLPVEEKTGTCIFCGTVMCGETKEESIHLPGVGYICALCIHRIRLAEERQLKKRNLQKTDGGMLKEHEAGLPEPDYGADDLNNESSEEELMDLEAVTVPVPKEIYSKLCEYVCGQDEAKRCLSAAVYKHFKGTQLKDENIRKSNVLMIGSTGTGKTYTVQILSKILNLPYVSVSATSMTENGWSGEDVEKCVEKLLWECSGNVSLAEHGIIFIDEIDKISQVGSSYGEYIVGRGGVQQALLKLIEGTRVSINFKQGNRQFPIEVDTSNILFICGGSFSGLEDIIRERITKNSGMGFGSVLSADNKEHDNLLKQVTNEDLRRYGMLGELLGRLPDVVVFEDVTKELLYSALTEPTGNLLWQYSRIFEADGIYLELDEAVKEYIVDRAYEENLGCRGLRKICEELFRTLMFELPGQVKGKVVVTKKYIDNYDIKFLKIEKK